MSIGLISLLGGRALSHRLQSSQSSTESLHKFPVDVRVVDLYGPHAMNDTLVVNYDDAIAAEVISNYPVDSYGWSVICDFFRIRVIGQRVVFILADGCNWGERPRLAAETCSQARPHAPSICFCN